MKRPRGARSRDSLPVAVTYLRWIVPAALVSLGAGLPLPVVACDSGRLAFGMYPASHRTCEMAPPEVEDPRTARHRERLAQAAQRQPDFAGCWRVVELPCGTSCQQVAVVHVHSGAVRWGPTASVGTEHRLDSALLVFDPPARIREAFGGETGHMHHLQTRYYRLDAGTMALEPVPSRRTGAAPFRLPPPIGYRFGSTAALHEALRSIVTRRDTAALQRILADDVLSSFGGTGGQAEFLAHWELQETPAQSRIWPVLARLLRWPPHETADEASGARAVWPYYVGRWPTGADPYAHAFAAEPSVPVRARPTPSADVIGRAGFEALEIVQPDGTSAAAPPAGWLMVRTRAGTAGYISRQRHVYPVVGYRLLVAQRASGWRITALVGGD